MHRLRVRRIRQGPEPVGNFARPGGRNRRLRQRRARRRRLLDSQSGRRNLPLRQVRRETRQDAYTDFKRTAPDSPVAEVLTAEQFSEAFRTDLADRKDLDAVVAAFTGRAGVQAVVPST
jgi:hypothetical protein